MSNQVQVNVRQIGSSASEGTAREHKAIRRPRVEKITALWGVNTC